MTTQPGVDYHHVRIRSGSPNGADATVEIDGKVDSTITGLRLDMTAEGVTRVAVTFLATVDVDTPAVLADPAPPSEPSPTSGGVVFNMQPVAMPLVNRALIVEAFQAGVRQGGMLR